MIRRKKSGLIAILLAVMMVFSMIPMSRNTVYAAEKDYLIKGIEGIMKGLNSKGQIMAGRYVSFEYADLMSLNDALSQALENGEDTEVGIRKSDGDTFILTPQGSTFSFTAPADDSTLGYYITVKVLETGEEYVSNTCLSINPNPVVLLSFEVDGQGEISANKYEVQAGEEITFTTTPAEGWYFEKLVAVTGSFGYRAGKDDTIYLSTEDTVIKAVFKEIVTTGSCGENATYSFDTQTGTLTISGTGRIADNAFNDYNKSDWDSVKEIVIQEGITEIGEKAFYYCKAFTNITLPKTLTLIDTEAFFGCKKLSSVSIPAKVTTIGTGAFQSCSALTSVGLSEGLETIGSSAFFSANLQSITIPQSVTALGENSFNNNLNLTTAVINAKITQLEAGAFSGCKKLSSVTLPETLVKIKNDAFSTCTALQTIQLPASITTISDNAFAYCTDLKSISIPSGVKTLANHAFFKCTSLTDVSLPEGFETIMNHTFSNCSGLTSIELPSTVTSIGVSAFGYCSKLTEINIPDGITTISDNCFTNCPNLTSIDLPSGVTEIGSAAFQNSGLTEMELPASLEKIGKYAFWGNPMEGTITIPEGVTSIGDSAFYHCEISTIVNNSGLTYTLASLFKSSSYPSEVISTWLNSDEEEVDEIGPGTYTRKIPIIDISTAEITGINASYTYTGSGIRPVPVVTVKGKVLTKDKDYTVTYKNVLDAGTATVTVTGMNNYSGSVFLTYSIVAKAITPTVTLSATSFAYNGKAKTPTVTVKDGTGVLVKNTDYTATYPTGRINAGTYKIVVKLKGNYSGSKTVSFVIKAKAITPTVKLSATSFVYNGKAKTPTVTVKDSTTALTKNTDYTVTYPTGRINVGTYKIVVKLKGNYSGSKTVSFAITKAANPLAVTAKTATASFTTLKTKSLTLAVGKVVTFPNKGIGALTYTKVTGNSAFTINKTTGAVTVKKGLKKGTYKIKMQIKAAGNANYKASAAKTVIFTVVVK